jgi:hypothetical protein
MCSKLSKEWINSFQVHESFIRVAQVREQKYGVMKFP